MTNAILLLTNRENPICVICLDGFEADEQQWSHVGGENHDPFHYRCLRESVAINPYCPIDRTEINPYSLIPRTEIIFKKLKKVFICASIASTIAIPLATSMFYITTSIIKLGSFESIIPALIIIGSGMGIGSTLCSRTVISALSQRLDLDNIDQKNIELSSLIGAVFGIVMPLGLKTQLLCSFAASAGSAGIFTLSKNCLRC